jgi:hypothetical protein
MASNACYIGRHRSGDCWKLQLIGYVHNEPCTIFAEVEIPDDPITMALAGAWAVHEPLQTSGPIYIRWAVSHVPTGLSVGIGFPKNRAKKLCQQLHKIVGDTPITGAGLPGIEPEMRRQILRAVNIASGYSETEAEAEPPLPRAEATK